MDLPFFSSPARKKRDQLIAVDLGGRTTKAIHLQRQGEGFALTRYVLLDAPIYEKTLSADMLTEHLKAIAQALEARTKLVTLAVGVNEALMRHVEMPRMPVDDMRLILKNNSKAYLQQELPNHVFDCYLIAPRSAEAAKAAANPQKLRALVTGARQQLVDDFQTAVKNAGLTPESFVPGILGPVNAFEMAMPQVFQQEVVALVDIGFRNSSICLINEGELELSRVVAIGGDRLTAGLAEGMGISYAEAEGIKVGMPQEVQPTLEALIVPLGRELRASIDFFEHQHDKPVTQVFVTGGSARSEFIMQSLQNQLVATCTTWSPTGFLQMALPPQQAAEIENIAPQLTVAIGAAMAVF